ILSRRSAMLPPVVSALIAFIATLFRSTVALRLENLALRHQLAVYKQTVHRPRLRSTDRLFWAWLSRLWPRLPEALAFVQPRTVIAWQRQRFRDHWRRLSQRTTPGRPAIAKDVRDLIRGRCGRPIPRGGLHASWVSCVSSASTWRNSQ